MSDHNNNETPGLLAGRYHPEQPVGRGSHATTWRGRDEKLDRPVAIKILHRQLSTDPVFVQRFRDEARVAASVRQANVVDIYDFGQEGETLYIVMQYVDGQDLKSIIEQRAPMDVREIRRIIGNVLDGLQAIHAAGIVHRDIKPQNILIGRDGVARVTDFGVAEVGTSSGLTGDGLTIGTVDYMAPEQAQGQPLTPAADLYATGVRLYEMLTGTLPFQGSAREIMLQHINTSVTPPSARMPQRGISAAMDAVVMQSLAKNPARRFSSARAMKQAIGSAFGGNGAANQATTVLPVSRPSPSPAPTIPWQPPTSDADAGSGLNGAFKGLLVVIFLGAAGILLWGAAQVMDFDRLDFPWSASSTATVEATVTQEPVQESTEPPQTDAVIQPIETVAPTATTAPEVEAPTPTETPVETPTPIPPTEESENVSPPIEPIDPDVSTETPEIEPAG